MLSCTSFGLVFRFPLVNDLVYPFSNKLVSNIDFRFRKRGQHINVLDMLLRARLEIYKGRRLVKAFVLSVELT